jgi:predicted transcriptional regulator
MNKKITVELSEAVLLRAQERAKEEGYETLDAYLDAIIRDDLDFGLDPAWLRARLEEGIADSEAGRVKPAEEVFERLESKYRAMAAKSRTR